MLRAVEGLTQAPVRRALPWLLPVLTAVMVLTGTGAGRGDIVRYAAYFGSAVVLPGVLLLRRLAPAPRSLAEEVGLGATVGLAWELVGWAVFTALGWQRWLLVWPALLVAVFAAFPRLRPCWRGHRPAALSGWYDVALAVLISAMLVLLYGTEISRSPMPPNAYEYYPDLLFHLGNVHELMRSVPPQIAQVSGETLQYHWFADAHLAAAVDITGIDPVVVLFRLWPAPVAVVMALAIAALARQISRTWWTAPLAVMVSTVATTAMVWKYDGPFRLAPLLFLSPSQSYGSTLSVGAAALLIGVLYQRAPRRSWVLVALLVLACAGSKPTTLPLLLAGTGLAALFLLLRHRRIPWPSVAVGAALVAVLGVSMLTVAGSTAGSSIRLLGVLRWSPGYSGITGDHSVPAPGGLLLQGLEHARPGAVAWAAVMLLALFVGRIVTFASLMTLGYRHTRRDPAQWWLAGTVLASVLAVALIDHSGASELYFLSSSIPFSAIALSSLPAAAVAGHTRRRQVASIGGGLVAGAVLTLVVRWLGQPAERPPIGEVTGTVAGPMIWLAAFLAAGAVGWFVLCRFRPSVTGLGIVVLVCALLGTGVPLLTAGDWADAVRAVVGSPRKLPVPAHPQTYPDEAAAALWLDRHSAPDDVVVTNTACVPHYRTPGCDARGYVVSGIGGRRTVLEGWGYTQRSPAEPAGRVGAGSGAARDPAGPVRSPLGVRRPPPRPGGTSHSRPARRAPLQRPLRPHLRTARLTPADRAGVSSGGRPAAGGCPASRPAHR